MLNAEKYKNEILEKSNVVFDFSISKDRHTIEKCLGVCDNCIFCNIGEHCSNVKVKWLLSEYKEPVKLSRLEYEILKWAKKEGYKYITRDEDCELCTFQSEPEKLNIAWDCCDVYIELPLFKKLFQFIQWADKKPTSIQEMLNNCEVIDGESE